MQRLRLIFSRGSKLSKSLRPVANVLCTSSQQHSANCASTRGTLTRNIPHNPLTILDYSVVLTDTTRDFLYISDVGSNVTDFGSRCLTFGQCWYISLAVNGRSEEADADASTGERNPVRARFCDCSCKQTAVLIIRDTAGCIERASSRPDILGRSRRRRSHDFVDDNSRISGGVRIYG